MSTNKEYIVGASGGIAGGSVAIAQDSQVEKQRRGSLSMLEDLLNTYGDVSIHKRKDGHYEVRAGGIATYGYNLSNQIERRVEVEVARVTGALAGDAEMQAKTKSP